MDALWFTNPLTEILQNSLRNCRNLHLRAFLIGDQSWLTTGTVTTYPTTCLIEIFEQRGDHLEDVFAKFKIMSDMTYTVEEEKQHLKRFTYDVKQVAAIGDLSADELEELFSRSRPALMESIADEINSKQSSWVASAVQPHFRGLSYGDVMDLYGGSIEARPYPVLPATNLTLNQVGDDLPLNFDGRKHFKECGDLIGHVPDQSNCGSCAAVSVAAAFSDRLCIKTEGKVKRLFSSGFLVACCNSDNGRTKGLGCRGGGETFEMWTFIQEYGFPTGGDNTPEGSMSEASGCWPYDFKKCNHNPQNEPSLLTEYPPCENTPAETPACSSTCPNDKYKTELEDDLHFTDDKGAVRLPSDVNIIKSELSQYGSVTANMEVYEDFRYYKSGIYKCKGQRIGAHSVKLIGWGKDGKDEYWLAVNSWNEEWGESGLIKIAIGQCRIETDVVYGDPEVDTITGLL